MENYIKRGGDYIKNDKKIVLGNQKYTKTATNEHSESWNNRG